MNNNNNNNPDGVGDDGFVQLPRVEGEPGDINPPEEGDENGVENGILGQLELQRRERRERRLAAGKYCQIQDPVVHRSDSCSKDQGINST